VSCDLDAQTVALDDERVLGLPEHVVACLFDLDGVLTDTASVHLRAWAETLDAFLGFRGGRPFLRQDYEDFIDGKPREDGVRDFLASRGVVLAEGEPDDPPDRETVHGIGNRKNSLLIERIRADGVAVYEGSRRYLEAAKGAGFRLAVVSSSANTADVLQLTGLDRLVDGRIDGLTLRSRHLRGKPAPDSFLAGATLLGTAPLNTAVFEDAIAGVAAGHDGGFGYVVGVNRVDDAHRSALREHGADVVVGDLSELL